MKTTRFRKQKSLINKCLLLTSILFYFFFTSCKELSKLTVFDFPVKDTVSFNAIPVANVPLSFTTPELKTDIKKRLSDYNSSTDMVDKITLKSLKLNILSPDTGNFNFLKKAKVYLLANDKPETLVAGIDAVPSSKLRTLDLDVSNTNLKDYILNDVFRLAIVGETDEPTNAPLQIEAVAVFTVDTKILGL
jgi:hypothetical protein